MRKRRTPAGRFDGWIERRQLKRDKQSFDRIQISQEVGHRGHADLFSRAFGHVGQAGAPQFLDIEAKHGLFSTIGLADRQAVCGLDGDSCR